MSDGISIRGRNFVKYDDQGYRRDSINHMNAANIKTLCSRLRYLRSGMSGLLAGFVSSLILTMTLDSIHVAVLPGSVIGIAYVVAFRNASCTTSPVSASLRVSQRARL